MSTAISLCECETIGAPQQIRFCRDHHRYWFGDRRLASFSHVLNTVYPQKREELEKLDPEVLEHARERGIRVDRYACEYVTTGRVEIPAGEWQEVLDRLGIFVEWFEKTKPIVRGVQQIVHDLDDGIAATKDFDFVLAGTPVIVDLKNTYSPDWTWKAQLGCHGRYSKNGADLYALHINPKLYTKTGYKLIPYSPEECMGIFDAARSWWKVLGTAKK